MDSSSERPKTCNKGDRGELWSLTTPCRSIATKATDPIVQLLTIDSSNLMSHGSDGHISASNLHRLASSIVSTLIGYGLNLAGQTEPGPRWSMHLKFSTSFKTSTRAPF